jgi:GAF domain-containing protein
MYMLHGDKLELEAFDGRPTEHTTIPVGTGVCGRAVAEARDINVADVSTDAGYLACSIETRSELVVLIRRGPDILGQIDIDSDRVNGFDDTEEGAVKEVADALAALL